MRPGTHPLILALVILLLGLAVRLTPVQAETVNCTAITSLPVTITTQGIYCLTGELATAITSGNAIEIATNNVVLDLNGFKLGGLGAGKGTTAHGIHGDSRQNITIRNGTVRGFLRGILLEDSSVTSQGNVIEEIRADQNTFVGIKAVGRGNIVRNNQVVATGGTTTFGANADARGIVVTGAEPLVLNNDVIDTVKQGTGTATGILFSSATDALAVNNRITQADDGIAYVTSTGKFRDNLTSSVATPFSGGTDAGNNN